MCCKNEGAEQEARFISDVKTSLEKKLRETVWVIDMLRRDGLLGHVCAPVHVEMYVSKKEQYNARIAGETLAAKFLQLYAQDPTLAWSDVSVNGDTIRLKIQNVKDRAYY